jgi:hypothetical protein
MGTRLWAVRDKEIIRVNYLYGPMLNETAISPLTFKVIHKYKNSSGVSQELVLHTSTIDPSYIRKEPQTQPGISPQVVQANFVNLRYIDNIDIQVEEVRNSVPLSTRVSVNNGTEEPVYNLPDNPLRQPEHHENENTYKPTEPVNNVVETIAPVQTVVYSFEVDGLEMVQSGYRVLFENNDFSEYLVGADPERFFIENSLENMLPNSSLVGIDTPTNWEIIAPGFITTSRLLSGEILNTKVWSIRSSNPNFLSAFNSLVIKSEIFPIPQGLGSMTFSYYHKLNNTINEIPYSSITTKFSFFDDTITFIGQEQVVSAVVSTTKQFWERREFTLSPGQIPFTATNLQISVEFGPIESSDYFTQDIYLPQLEPFSSATTYTTSRVEDRYRTLKEVSLEPPYYIVVETLHEAGFGMRGLFDNTFIGSNGIQFGISGNSLALRVFGPSNSLILNVSSTPVVAQDRQKVKYGVALSSTQVKFYLDDTLISTHPHSLNLSYLNYAFVGSWFNSNSTINSELFNFGVFKVLP